MKNGKLLDLYSDYLISAFGATTATGLSALLNGEISHDSVQRYLAGERQTSVLFGESSNHTFKKSRARKAR